MGPMSVFMWVMCSMSFKCVYVWVRMWVHVINEFYRFLSDLWFFHEIYVFYVIHVIYVFCGLFMGCMYRMGFICSMHFFEIWVIYKFFLMSLIIFYVIYDSYELFMPFMYSVSFLCNLCALWVCFFLMWLIHSMCFYLIHEL